MFSNHVSNICPHKLYEALLPPLVCKKEKMETEVKSVVVPDPTVKAGAEQEYRSTDSVHTSILHPSYFLP